MAREPIDFDDPDTMRVLIFMAEGNPGGASALALCSRLIDDYYEIKRFLKELDAANIRGGQIWVGFKDVCDQDPQTFIDKVRSRDQAMLDRINEECVYDEYQEVAAWPST